VRANAVIDHENLQTANMLKHHHLAKGIQDAEWAAFLSIRIYKEAWAGRSVVAVNPAYTSEICPGCGALAARGLCVRWHACPACGVSLHRDHNAAKNIERLGQSRRGALAQAMVRASSPPPSCGCLFLGDLDGAPGV
jgi:putative transposase